VANQARGHRPWGGPSPPRAARRTPKRVCRTDYCRGRHDRKGHRRLVLAGSRPQSLTVPDPTEVRSGECTRLGRLGGGETIGDDAAEVVTESRRARQSSGSKALPLSRVIARKESPIGPEHAGKVETRHDRINNAGNVNIRHDDRLHHIGIGRTYPGRASSSSLRTARSASSTPSPASSERAHPRPAPRLPAPHRNVQRTNPKMTKEPDLWQVRLSPMSCDITRWG